MSVITISLHSGTQKYPGGPQGTLGTVQYCTVLFIGYDKKNQKRAAECGLGEARF